MRTEMKKTLCIILCLAALLGLSSCGGKRKYTEYYFDYFDTVVTVTMYSEDGDEFAAVCELIRSELENYDRLFDIYNTCDGINNLKTVNDRAGEWVAVDEKIIDLLEFSTEMYSRTQGRTSIALGAVTRLWKNAAETLVLPTRDELLSAAEHTDINDLLIDRENLAVKISDEKMSLDVGAVAKGYVLSKIAALLKEKGAENTLLNFGGSVAAVGTKPDGKYFVAGINDADGNLAAEIPLDGVTVVTSGAYARFFELDGKKYGHIIDAKTLYPADGFYSVSVICPDAGLGDALSTALFCMTREEGEALIGSIDGARAIWIAEE